MYLWNYWTNIQNRQGENGIEIRNLMAVPLIGAIIGLHKRDMEEGYRQQRIHLWDLLPNKCYMIIKEINCKKLNVYSLISGFHRASLLSVTFINQLMHSIITVVDVKISLYKSLKTHIKNYSNMFRITQDRSSGSDNLNLTEITYNKYK